jgi:hypothetical protein
MAIEVSDLWFAHSGGAANQSPLADLGGDISTHANKRVLSQSSSGLTNVTGVVIDDAYGNAEGSGTLSFVYNGGTGRTLGWKPYGFPTSYGDVVDANGTYVIGSSAGYLEVTVTLASLPVADKVDTVGVNNVDQNIFDQVNASQSLSGIVQYRCLYILNTSGADNAAVVTLWIANQTDAGDDIAIGKFDTGKNSSPTLLGDDVTTPADVTFSAPSSQGAGINLGTLNFGDRHAIWIRRTVPVETRGTVIGNNFQLGLSVDI